MATTTIVQKGQPGSKAFFRDSFLLHKLHSLSGIFPIGFFMIFHLTANSYSLRGELEFNTVVKTIGYFPFVSILEWALIFIPLIFHSIYGFMITAEMRANTGTYQYGRNWLYTMQRISGVLAFAYIVYHTINTWGLRKVYEMGGGPHADEFGFRAISYDAMIWRFADNWYTAIYVLGIAMAAFHLGNGMFNFGIRWGLTIGKQAQRVSAILWIGLAAALTFIGCWTAVNFHQKADNYKGSGQSIRVAYPTLDELVKSEPAPALNRPGAKPVSVDGGKAPAQ